MKQEPNPPGTGCLAICIAMVTFIVGIICAYRIVPVFVMDALRLRSPIWHFIIGCILLGFITLGIGRIALLKRKIYIGMAALGFALGYGLTYLHMYLLRLIPILD